MSQSPAAAPSAVHCINPDCTHPYPQLWGNRFCQACGSPLILQGRYLPLKRIGEGGFAVTYTVYDPREQVQKVLKVLLSQVPKALELFEQEARVLASLHHPGVPQVEPGNYFTVPVGHPPDRSLPCLVMEKINGKTLQAVLDEQPYGCPEEWVFNWLWQATEILQVLHDRHIIHRDLKPANLMLRQDTGQLVLIDFGGAKQMRSFQMQPGGSTRLFSPGYSPPEQVAGGGLHPASDFYALGRTFIHLLTHRYPVDLEDPQTGMLHWRTATEVSPALADLLDEMVHPNVQRRPASAAVVLARLESMLPTASEPIAASPRRGQRSVSTVRQRGFGIKALFGGVFWIFRAIFDTLWGVLWGGLGGGLGTIGGIVLAYVLPIGRWLTEWLAQQLQTLLPNVSVALSVEVVIFALAGWGTALGLTIAGGFEQRRRLIIGSLMGGLSYVVGWLALQLAIPDGAAVGLALFGAIAPPLLTLGLGLPAPHLLYAVVTGGGVAMLLAGLANLGLPPIPNFWQWLSPTEAVAQTLSGTDLWAALLTLTLLGGAIGLCLGIGHYIVRPLTRALF